MSYNDAIRGVYDIEVGEVLEYVDEKMQAF